MKLYSYVVARDYGFAPNPFFGACTLATCKPNIRRVAKVGDWVLGTGCADRGLTGRAVYAMRITETMTYDEYWSDPRFQCKKPNLSGSKKQAFGDNIYHKDAATGLWHQQNSHHSLENGQPNPANIENDTQTNRVLIGTKFMYWGGAGPQVPAGLRSYQGFDVCAGRNHKSQFPHGLEEQVVEWLRSFGESGYLGLPHDWSRSA
ncbi:MAG: hypothetical protein U1E42_03795 [Rhodospirillales bacterium]